MHDLVMSLEEAHFDILVSVLRGIIPAKFPYTILYNSYALHDVAKNSMSVWLVNLWHKRAHIKVCVCMFINDE